MRSLGIRPPDISGVYLIGAIAAEFYDPYIKLAAPIYRLQRAGSPGKSAAKHDTSRKKSPPRTRGCSESPITDLTAGKRTKHDGRIDDQRRARITFCYLKAHRIPARDHIPAGNVRPAPLRIESIGIRRRLRHISHRSGCYELVLFNGQLAGPIIPHLHLAQVATRMHYNIIL